MKGLMMDTPLMIGSIMDHADKNFPDQEIVSVVADQPDFRYTFKEAFQRTRQLGNALKSLGIDIGDRVGTLAWNDHRHFELYYAISSSGAICHTVNPRLFPEQLIYIMNHAEDKVVFCDPMFVPLLESIQDQLESIEHFIVLTSEDSMPDSSLKGLLCYESILAQESDEIEWPEFDETTASGMCYTSGPQETQKAFSITTEPLFYMHMRLVCQMSLAFQQRMSFCRSFQCFMSILGVRFMSAQWLAARSCFLDLKWVTEKRCNN